MRRNGTRSPSWPKALEIGEFLADNSACSRIGIRLHDWRRRKRPSDSCQCDKSVGLPQLEPRTSNDSCRHLPTAIVGRNPNHNRCHFLCDRQGRLGGIGKTQGKETLMLGPHRQYSGANTFQLRKWFKIREESHGDARSLQVVTEFFSGVAATIESSRSTRIFGVENARESSISI